MNKPVYFELLSSLPSLIHFQRAEYLPINRSRLQQRLALLQVKDAYQLTLAQRLIVWQYNILNANSARSMKLYYRCVERIRNIELRKFVEFKFNLLSVITAFRFRYMGMSKPEIWWPRGKWIRAHWGEPLFKLDNVYRWLSEARKHIETSNVLSLVSLVLDEVWQYARRLAERHGFSFEAVVAYVFQWEIVGSWLNGERDRKSHVTHKSAESIIVIPPISIGLPKTKKCY